jgi:hypothetical protein
LASEERQVIRAEPVTIPAGTAALDGLYYEPEPSGAAARGAVQLMHGNAGHFYTGREAETGRLVAEWLGRTLPAGLPG